MRWEREEEREGEAERRASREEINRTVEDRGAERVRRVKENISLGETRKHKEKQTRNLAPFFEINRKGANKLFPNEEKLSTRQELQMRR